MAPIGYNVLYGAIQATQLHAHKSSSSQDNDAPEALRDRKTAHDADGVYQFLYRIFDLPTEIRDMIWAFACGGSPIIKLDRSTPNGILSLMLAVEDPEVRSEGVMGLWKSFTIEWVEKLDHDKAWPKFKKTVIPHIRCLTINFSLCCGIVLDQDNEISQTITWMGIRGKPGNRARYGWSLEQLHLVGLHLVGLRHHTAASIGRSGWYLWEDLPLPDCKHWSEHWKLKSLRKDEVKVTVETKDREHRIIWVDGGKYCR